MRITLHAVHAGEYQVFREAMEPTLRSSRLGRLLQGAGITTDRVDALIEGMLEHTVTPRTSAELKTWLEQELGAPPDASVMAGLRGYAPLLHAPTGEHWSFGLRPSYITAPARPTIADDAVSAQALQALVMRYLEGFGPASIADIAQFALVQQKRLKDAIAALADGIERLDGPDGKDLYDIPGGVRPDEDAAAPPRLMAMWDSILLAYNDRSRIIPPTYRKTVIRNNGDVLPTLLVDGYVAGVWRSVEGGIEATAFHPLPDCVWDQLAIEAQALSSFITTRTGRIYTRFHRWWEKLPPDAETRMLVKGDTESG